MRAESGFRAMRPTSSGRGATRWPALLLVALGWLVAGTAVADDHAMVLPQDSADAHMGVASCASGVCHGAVRAMDATNVMQNEFVIWTREDPHATAYQTLLDDESVAIARKLGLPNAHEADICLDCHADNAKHRDNKFSIADGVGCEGCHGGAERYLSSHTADGVTHEENLANGLYPTEDLEARAQLCLSCHLGNDDKFATHRIMGAGHPRMSFELDTFGALQPAHYLVDADYIRRKHGKGSVETWLTGLVVSARETLDLIQGPRFNGGGVFPELSLFDCHSCHHPMSEQRWTPSATATRVLGPGAMRLNDASITMLTAVASAVSEDDRKALNSGLAGMHGAIKQSRGAVVAASERLEQSVDRFAAKLDGRAFSDAEMAAMVNAIIRDGRRGVWRDYTSAEQATMALDLLLLASERADSVKSEVDRLYATVQDEEAFSPARFGNALAALANRLGA